jgi:hypothetical protein
VLRAGQFVRCVVTSLSKEGGQKRIELSCNPTLVNSGIRAEDIQKGLVRRVLWSVPVSR